MVNKFFRNDTGSGWLIDAQTESHASGYENKLAKILIMMV